MLPRLINRYQHIWFRPFRWPFFIGETNEWACSQPRTNGGDKVGDQICSVGYYKE